MKTGLQQRVGEEVCSVGETLLNAIKTACLPINGKLETPVVKADRSAFRKALLQAREDGSCGLCHVVFLYLRATLAFEYMLHVKSKTKNITQMLPSMERIQARGSGTMTWTDIPVVTFTQDLPTVVAQEDRRHFLRKRLEALFSGIDNVWKRHRQAPEANKEKCPGGRGTSWY